MRDAVSREILRLSDEGHTVERIAAIVRTTLAHVNRVVTAEHGKVVEITPRDLSEPPNRGWWTDDRVRQLRDMWISGLTCSAIADRLGDGISRSAVIGKIHRLHLNLSGERREGRVRKTDSPWRKPALRPSKEKVSRETRTFNPNADLASLRLITYTPVVDPDPTPGAERKQLVAFDAKGNDIGVGRYECRWMYEDGGHPEHGCCARAVVPGTSWCVHHLDMVFRPAHAEREQPDSVPVHDTTGLEIEIETVETV